MSILNKKSIFFLILLTILFPLGLFGLTGMDKKPVQSPLITKNNTIPTATPMPTSILSADPEKRLLDKISTRRTLSKQNQAAKEHLIALVSANSNTGTLSDNDLFVIEYIKAPDLFKVEIKTTDIDAAKEQAVQWFISKGFSHQGICELPVSFYLDFETSRTLKDQKEPFNPLPEGC